MTKTRQQLKDEGVLLKGPLVPEWFKGACDGCSVPGYLLRIFLMAEQARAACRIHDFEYFLGTLNFKPRQAQWKGVRMTADYRLKQNRTKVAYTKIGGFVYGALYYIGVRPFGKYAMGKDIKDLPVPPTLDDIQDLKEHAKTIRAEAVLAEWEAEHVSR